MIASYEKRYRTTVSALLFTCDGECEEHSYYELAEVHDYQYRLIPQEAIRFQLLFNPENRRVYVKHMNGERTHFLTTITLLATSKHVRVSSALSNYNMAAIENLISPIKLPKNAENAFCNL